jgi:hypothetical protein
MLGKRAFTQRTIDVGDRLRVATDALDGQLELAAKAGARCVCPAIRSGQPATTT